MVYVHGKSRQAEEISKQAAAKRAEATALRKALEEDRAASRELMRAQQMALPYKPSPYLREKAEGVMEWANTHLPKPRYGGRAGLAEAAREILDRRGRNRALVKV